jgi:hypothetical protein
MNTQPCRMPSESWLQRAERLRSTLSRVRDSQRVDTEAFHHDPADVERVAIAHWLREEFSEEPHEDTATLPLFPSHG